jgi:hypothetical protein
MREVRRKLGPHNSLLTSGIRKSESGNQAYGFHVEMEQFAEKPRPNGIG